ELVADLERALEVDAPPGPPFSQRCHRQRLGADVEGDRRTAFARLDADDGQAGAGIGDRGANGNRPRLVSARELEPPELAGRRNINELANIAYNPSEHPKPFARAPGLFDPRPIPVIWRPGAVGAGIPSSSKTDRRPPHIG